MEDPKKLEEGYGGDNTPQILVKEEESRKFDSAHNDSRLDSTSEVANGAGDDPEEQKTKGLMNQPKQEEEQMVVTKPKKKRIATLDAFRGLTVVVIH